MIFAVRIMHTSTEPQIELYISGSDTPPPAGFDVCPLPSLLIWWRRRDRLTMDQLIAGASAQQLLDAANAAAQPAERFAGV